VYATIVSAERYILFLLLDIGAAVHERNLAHLKDTKQHEAKLSKVKRDLTKAVVSLRQAERYYGDGDGSACFLQSLKICFMF